MAAPTLGQNRPSDLLKPHQNEAVKMYIVYDGSNRMIETYTAVTDAQDGDQCMKTVYTYAGASNRIIKMKESLDVWVAATMD